MHYLLDTNVCVDYLTGRYPPLTEKLLRHRPRQLWLSTIVLAELRYGLEKSSARRRNERALRVLSEQLPVLDFDSAAASAYGQVRAGLERAGRPIGAYDLLIAAQALAADLTLVTDNVKEFGRVSGLRLENWRR